MKPFEDSIPEEQKEKLVELLRDAYRQDQMLFEREHQASLARVAERLARLDEDETPYIVSLPKSVSGSSWFDPQSKRVRSKGRMRLISVLAAVLVVGILVSSAALIFTQYVNSPAGLSYTPRPGKLIPMAAPVVVKRGGLEMSMQVTQGPYFLGELLAVDLSLTNHTHSAIKLFGNDDSFKPQQGKSNNSIESPCSSFSLHPEQTGGIGPYYTLYKETVPFVFACSEIGNGPTFVVGQTIVDHFYVL
ncbi:MAG TPA: hypothetical protein VFN23_07565 [Ktedonobacteraceae bacterium]|nr:hypothetical protein [Ktedonobacteraceae bacterium]